jgi:sugar lactone lactonase YvrE
MKKSISISTIFFFLLFFQNCTKKESQIINQPPTPSQPVIRTGSTIASLGGEVIFDVNVDKNNNLLLAVKSGFSIFNSIGVKQTYMTGQCNSCNSIATDIQGNIYLADGVNNIIHKYSGSTLTKSTFLTIESPSGIFVENTGNVYICSKGTNNKIVKVDNTGKTLLTIGSRSINATDDQIISPDDVFVDKNGFIYVSDLNKNRVQKWSPDGKTVTTIVGGIKGNGKNQVNGPTGVYVDDSLNIYICESSNNRVQKWSPGSTSGVTVAGGNGEGSSQNQLNFPVDLWVDSYGYIFIVDRDNRRVQKWTPY